MEAFMFLLQKFKCRYCFKFLMQKIKKISFLTVQKHIWNMCIAEQFFLFLNIVCLNYDILYTFTFSEYRNLP